MPHLACLGSAIAPSGVREAEPSGINVGCFLPPWGAACRPKMSADPESLSSVFSHAAWWLGLVYLIWVHLLGGTAWVSAAITHILAKTELLGRLRVYPANYPLVRDTLVVVAFALILWGVFTLTFPPNIARAALYPIFGRARVLDWTRQREAMRPLYQAGYLPEGFFFGLT